MASYTGPIQHKRGTSSQWASSSVPLRSGEIGYDTSVKRMKIGNGSALWSALPWATTDNATIARLEGLADAVKDATTPTVAAMTAAATDSGSTFAQALNAKIAASAPMRRVSATRLGIDPSRSASQNSDAFDAFVGEYGTHGWILEFPAYEGQTYDFARPLVLGDTSQIIGQGGMLLTQTSGATELEYRPSVTLNFPNGTDGVVTDAASTERVQGPRVKNVLIKGSGSTNGHAGLALYPAGGVGDPYFRKVGLAYMEDVYIEHFSVGLDFQTADSATFFHGHISECDILIQGGQSECRVDGCALWRATTAVWKIDDSSSFGHRMLWFVNNEVEPESATADVLYWKDVQGGVVAQNQGRASIGRFAYFTGTTKRIIIEANLAEVAKSFVKCDATTNVDALVIANNIIVSTASPADEALDLRGTGFGYHMVSGNSTAGTFTTTFRAGSGQYIAWGNNRFTTLQFDSEAVITLPTGVMPHGRFEAVARAATPAVRARNISDVTGGRVPVERLYAQSTGAATTGFGPALEFAISDTTAATTETVRNRIQSVINSSSTNRSDLIVEVWRDGASGEALRVLNSGGLRLTGVSGGTPEIQFGGDPSVTAGTPRIMFGAGTPEGVKIASRGSLYLRTDGGTATSIYVKESGNETNTGWVAK